MSQRIFPKCLGLGEEEEEEGGTRLERGNADEAREEEERSGVQEGDSCYLRFHSRLLEEGPGFPKYLLT